MSSSLRFSNKGNKKFLQPPTLYNFDIFSSQDKQQSYEHQIQQLSNVEQKSFFQSEPQEPQQSDIQQFLGKMKEIGDQQLPPQSPRKSQRLQDQQIIVVEEENQVGSNLGDNQSVILEQIQFGNETHPDNTPQWQHRQDGIKIPKEQIYVINLIGDSPNFMAKDHQNISSSTPWDIQSSEYKLSHNRNSKNTCVDRVELLDTENKVGNKSCIEKPISFDSDQNKNSKKLAFPSQKKNKTKNLQFILDKWQHQIYPNHPQLQLQSNQLGRRGSADFQMQRDAKFCTSKYKGQSSQGNISKIEDEEQLMKQKESKNFLMINDNSSLDVNSKTSIMKKAYAEVQTNQLGWQIQQNQQKLNEEINQLQYKNQRLTNQLTKIKQRLESQANQLNKTRESLKNKDSQLQKLKSTYRTQVQSQQKKWGQQSRRLSQKNKELQKVINNQNSTIKQYEQKNQALQKQLNKTVSYNTFSSTERSPTFFGNNNQSQSVRFNKNQIFMSQNQQINTHEKCKKQIQELQEYIFDLQQKFAGIDIQVEKRVRIISETIESQITNKLNHQHKTVIMNLREQLNKYQSAYQHLEFKHRQQEEKFVGKQREIYQKQKEVNKMYEELKKEWRQIQKQSQMQKKYLYKNQPKINKYYSPKSAVKPRFDYQKNNSNFTLQSQKLNPFISSPPSQYQYCSNKQIKTPNFKRDGLSFTKNNIDNNTSISYMTQEDTTFRKGLSRLNQSQKPSISFTRALDQNQWDKKQIAKTQHRQNSQLTAINNKIQRLRKQINKELCSIH